ncbi:unnamed protein product [Agarophyton chilense]
MSINDDGLWVYYTHPRLYPEQYEFMSELMNTIDSRSYYVIDMPTGIIFVHNIVSPPAPVNGQAYTELESSVTWKCFPRPQVLMVVMKHRDECYM